MSDELFYLVYFSPLFLSLILGIIAVLVGSLRFKMDFTVDKLSILKKKYKKKMVLYFIMTVLIPITLIPLYILKPRIILIIQFIILFFIISFSLTFMSYLQKYLIIRKKIRDNDSLAVENAVRKLMN